MIFSYFRKKKLKNRVDRWHIFKPKCQFRAIWCILWTFVIFYGHLEDFSCFGMLFKEKSGNPAEKMIKMATSTQIAENSLKTDKIIDTESYLFAYT
jgi:hypothetical protein